MTSQRGPRCAGTLAAPGLTKPTYGNASIFIARVRRDQLPPAPPFHPPSLRASPPQLPHSLTREGEAGARAYEGNALCSLAIFASCGRENVYTAGRV